MMEASTIQKLGNSAIEDSRGIDWGKINRDINRCRPLYSDQVDPRRTLHLDTNKLAYHRDRVEAFIEGERVAPITIDMALTQKCGFACTYCYAGLQKNPASPADWDTYKYFLDDCTAIGHQRGEGVKAISLVSDGESTMNPHFYEFIRYGKSLGIDMASGTNGHKLVDEELDELLRNLTYLRINISAGEPDAFAKVMGVKEPVFHEVVDKIKKCVAIKRKNQLPVTIGLQMVLLPEYIDQVLPLALLGRELGVDYTVIKHCSDDEHGRLGVDYAWYHKPEVSEVLHFAEGLSTADYSVQAKWSKLMTGNARKYSRCFGPALMLQMSGTCLVAPCGSLFHTDYEEFHIGNYAVDRFKDIWASERYWSVMGHLCSDEFDPRHRCAALCLQDKVNEKLFQVMEEGGTIDYMGDGETRQHVNFI